MAFGRANREAPEPEAEAAEKSEEQSVPDTHVSVDLQQADEVRSCSRLAFTQLVHSCPVAGPSSCASKALK